MSHHLKMNIKDPNRLTDREMARVCASRSQGRLKTFEVRGGMRLMSTNHGGKHFSSRLKNPQRPMFIISAIVVGAALFCLWLAFGNGFDQKEKPSHASHDNEQERMEIQERMHRPTIRTHTGLEGGITASKTDLLFGHVGD